MKSTIALKEQVKKIVQQKTNSVKSLLTEIEMLRSEIEKQENKISLLKQQALEDPLTEIPNRRAFEDNIQSALSYCKRYNRNGAILLIDVDAFKGINDSLGHLAGDALLKHLASVLKSYIRDTDFVARIGGDEFCIILREVSEEETLRKIKEIETALSVSPCSYEGKDIYISISIGFCQFKGGEDKDELLSKADRCMYAQKNNLTLIDNS